MELPRCRIHTPTPYVHNRWEEASRFAGGATVAHSNVHTCRPFHVLIADIERDGCIARVCLPLYTPAEVDVTVRVAGADSSYKI